MEDYIQNDALKHSNDFMQLPQFGTFLFFFFFCIFGYPVYFNFYKDHVYILIVLCVKPLQSKNRSVYSSLLTNDD